MPQVNALQQAALRRPLLRRGLASLPPRQLGPRGEAHILPTERPARARHVAARLPASAAVLVGAGSALAQEGIDDPTRAPYYDSFKGKRVAISGSGNVAQYAALKAIELGATIVSLSDSKGAIIATDLAEVSERLQFTMSPKGLRIHFRPHP